MSHTVFTVNDRMRNSHREYDTILALHLNENPLESKFSDVWSFLVCCIGTRQLVVDIEDVGYKKVQIGCSDISNISRTYIASPTPTSNIDAAVNHTTGMIPLWHTVCRIQIGVTN